MTSASYRARRGVRKPGERGKSSAINLIAANDVIAPASRSGRSHVALFARY